MRLALRFVVDFLGSGHVNTTKILGAYHEQGRYTISVHEFLRALLYGDHRYYDPDSSPIANVLRITRPDGREHFLLPIVLTQTQVFGEQAQQEGYVSTDMLHSFCQQLGFTSDQVVAALGYAVAHRLLDSSPRYTMETRGLYYRITTVGAYTAKVLLIEDVHSLTDRVSRAEYFRLYLDKQRAGIPQGASSWKWPDSSGRLAADIARVGKIADPKAWRHR